MGIYGSDPWEWIDAEKAAYESSNPIGLMRNDRPSLMRAGLGGSNDEEETSEKYQRSG